MDSLSKTIFSKDGKKCFLCSKEMHPQFKPFCSKRCQQIDLGKWFSGVYSIPTEEIGIIPEEEEN